MTSLANDQPAGRTTHRIDPPAVTGDAVRDRGAAGDEQNPRDAVRRLTFENAFLAQLLNDVREAVIATDLDGGIIYWGRGAERLYGYRSDDVFGRDARILVDPRDLNGSAERLDAAMRDGVWSGTYRKRRADGTVIWVNSTISPIENLKGERWGFVAIDRDETSARITRDALLESERLLRSLAEHMSAVYWVEDVSTGHPILVSSGSRTIFGLEPTEFVAEPKRRFDCIHEDDREGVREDARGSGHTTIEYRVVDPGGRIRWIRQQSFDVHDAEGRPLRRGVLAEDITRSRLAVEQSERHRSMLAQVARASSVGEMATSLAHELNQPLCAIANEAQACLRGIRDETFTREESIECLNDLYEEALRAGEVIRRVRSLVARNAPSRGTFPISDVIENIVELLGVRVRESNTRIDCHVDPKASRAISADRVQVEQVLTNLLTNAIDATSGNATDDRHIVIHVDAEPDRTVVTVTDNGCGIPDDQHEQVFEVYVTTKPNGLGMGLAICRTIVESHGGSLRAEPNRPRGTRMTMTLPMED